MIPTPIRGAVLLALGVVAIRVTPASAQAGGTPPATQATVRRLSLDEALTLAEGQSEAVEIARAGATRARGQQFQARSQFLPQLYGSLGYTRQLKSQFEGLNLGGGDTTGGGGGGGGFDFSQTGFGAENQWALGLQLSQNVFTGGRVTGQTRAAAAGRQAAEIELAAQRAQIALDVTKAYYDATLADKLVAIAASSLQQTEDVLRQTRVARQVGNQSEFELLRAQVTRDNQVPVLIQRRSDRQVAYLRLKQLLNLPLDDSLDLATPIEQTDGPVLPAVAVNGVLVSQARLDTVVGDRAPVRQAESSVRAQENLWRVARGERFPQIAITSGYQRLFFPRNTFPDFGEYRQNWTVGVSAQLPLFTGGRIRGSEMVAAANLQEARARLQQTREFAALDTRLALNTYEQAEAAWRASQGTAEQAAKAYSIDQIRYREGISTQTDLTQSRLLLEQAVVNRVVAARDLAIARIRLALLRDLPIQGANGPGGAAGAGMAPGSGGAMPGQAQQPAPSPQPRTTQSAASAAGGPLGSRTP